MKQLKFRYIKARNFLCFGPDGVELNFDDFGNVINICGHNLDSPTRPPRSNGAGKSTIFEIPCYALYGKTIKDPKKIKTHVCHRKIGKKLYAEVQWDKYRVVRTRKPDKLEFWESEDHIWNDDTKVDVSKGETQQLIDKAIGMNYDTFINVVIFSDKNKGAFLECDPEEKRLIVENLLSLEKYREYGDVVKQLKKDLKNEQMFLLREYEKFLELEKSAQRRVEMMVKQEVAWIDDLKKQIANYEEKLASKKQQLGESEAGAAIIVWQKARDRLEEISIQQAELEQKKTKMSLMLQDIQKKNHQERDGQHQLKLQLNLTHDNIKRDEKKIKEYRDYIHQVEGRKGTRCPMCFGIVAEENCEHALTAMSDKIVVTEQEIITEKNTAAGLENKLKQKEAILLKLSEAASKISTTQSNINKKMLVFLKEVEELNRIPRPEGNNTVLLLEQEINEIKKQLDSRNSLLDSGKSPYTELIVEAKKEHKKQYSELNEKKKLLEEAQELMRYYEYWAEAFGDSGIRKWIIEGIVPALNDGVAYWLNVLLDGIVTLTFDNELNAEIQSNPPDGDPYHYCGMSAGEHRMLNLSVSHAFAHVMTLSWGASPSVVFLDEIGSNMDEVARKGVYNMICELAKDKQVFVTTHDPFLQELLLPYETIVVEKENGFTRIM